VGSHHGAARTSTRATGRLKGCHQIEDGVSSNRGRGCHQIEDGQEASYISYLIKSLIENLIHTLLGKVHGEVGTVPA
jgi:hypothetical protein